MDLVSCSESRPIAEFDLGLVTRVCVNPTPFSVGFVGLLRGRRVVVVVQEECFLCLGGIASRAPALCGAGAFFCALTWAVNPSLAEFKGVGMTFLESVSDTAEEELSTGKSDIDPALPDLSLVTGPSG